MNVRYKRPWLYPPGVYEPQPAIRVRERIFYHGIPVPPGADRTGAERYELLHGYLRDEYDQARKCLAEALELADDVTAILARLELFYAAAGLFSFGHLEVVDELLDSIPEDGGDYIRYVWAVPALLPIPDWMDPLLYRAQVKHWIHRNVSRLAWSESRGRYIWRNPESK